MSLLLIIGVILAGISVLCVINCLTLPRLRMCAQPYTAPTIAILIPARNEAAVIAHTIHALRAQTHLHFSVILLDDASTDDTHTVALGAIDGDPRFRLIFGTPLPLGWMGKNWACHQLAHHTTADILIFTDADTRWQPQALSALISHMHTTHADLLTLWSTQITHTWAERLVVPLMNFAVMSYLPILLTHYAPFAIFGAANGQCMAWRRDAYNRVGGHEAVAGNVLEDVTMARKVKWAGLRLRMADANQLISCRMYTGWDSVRDGYAKNILAGYGNSVAALLASTVFHWALFVLPWGLLCLESLRMWGVVLVLLGVFPRALSAAYSHQRITDALFMPLSVILMTHIALLSIYWHTTGGVRWKGRTLPTIGASS